MLTEAAADINAAMQLLRRQIGKRRSMWQGASIANWNDAPERTLQDVINALREAAK